MNGLSSAIPRAPMTSQTIADLEDQRTRLQDALSELKSAQARLLQAQKLESIGQLAAGIAHEINTPTQYVTDNVQFLLRAFEKVGAIVGASRELIERIKAGEDPAAAIAQAEDVFKKARVDYVLKEAPKALQQSLDGLQRVASIVKAMKDFSHPSAGEKQPVNLDDAITSTITVATNEWKYVADIETYFDPELPLVPCMRDEVNQVFLNLIVNAAHAIDEKTIGGSLGRGTIKIEARPDGEDWVEVRVSDSGCGIPEHAQNRVFDPFFTTKAVGKGTGQGLAIAYSVIVDKHGGEIEFETEIGAGTTFIVRLPVNVHEERPSTFYAPLRSLP